MLQVLGDLDLQGLQVLLERLARDWLFLFEWLQGERLSLEGFPPGLRGGIGWQCQGLGGQQAYQ
ncbi:hypothetical protein GCM10010222_80400 [Streptomyces tanashiensis]|nr:hypothetical protein GCM10010222_80400 [Streptomyces tanashiensis]